MGRRNLGADCSGGSGDANGDANFVMSGVSCRRDVKEDNTKGRDLQGSMHVSCWKVM